MARCDLPYAGGWFFLGHVLRHHLAVAARDLNLCVGNFTRASLCLVSGMWMLLWWFDKPRSWEDFGPGACFFVGLGALATFVRWRKKQQAMQVIPTTMPTWTPPKAPANDNLITLFVKDKS